MIVSWKSAENGEELGEEEEFNVDALIQEEFAEELMVNIQMKSFFLVLNL